MKRPNSKKVIRKGMNAQKRDSIIAQGGYDGRFVSKTITSKKIYNRKKNKFGRFK